MVETSDALNLRENSASRGANTPLIEEAISSREELIKVLKDNFDKNDTYRNGFLSESEVLKVANGNNFNSKEFEAFFLASKYFFELKNVRNDEWGFEKKGVSKGDLDKLAALPDKHRLSADLDRALALFPKLTIEQVTNPQTVARDLEEGNPLSLAFGLNQQKNYDQRKQFFSAVAREISSHKEQDPTVPKVSMSSGHGVANEVPEHLYFRVGIAPGGRNNGRMIYQESFSPRYGERYNASLSTAAVPKK